MNHIHFESFHHANLLYLVLYKKVCVYQNIQTGSQQVKILTLPNERTKAFSVAKWQSARAAANIYTSPNGNCLLRSLRWKHCERTF